MTFFDVITIAWTLVVALLLFGVTVFVHELGHFLAARRMGLVVEKFAIGFGPTLYSFKWDGVEYAIKALPLGGFVQLPQMAPMDMVEGETANKKEDLPSVTPWAKIVTAFWGPAASFLLAVFLAVVVWIVGKPDYVTLHSTQIGFLQKDAPAEKAGFKLGDTILAINDRKVDRWAGGVDGVKENIVLSDTDKIKFELRGLNGQIRDVWVKPELNKEQENLRTIGVLQSSPLIIDQINLKSPASTAGLQKGDEILKADGETLWSPYQLMNLVQASKGPMQLEVKRGDRILPISITPLLVKNKEIKEKGKEIKDIGVSWAEGLPITIYPSPLTQIGSSATLIYRTLSALFSPKSDVGVGHLSGAIGIFNTIMLLLRYEPAQLLAFCVMFNVNLALLNMLPIPILDGGHILFSLIEAIRRRPVSLKIMSAVQTATFVLMIGLFLFISYRDVLRVGKRYSVPKPEKLEDVQFETSPETIKN